MGRKQTNTVEYFPHYANASDKDTLTILENYFGNDGYSFWFKLLEKLCSTEGHYIDCNNLIKWQCFVAKSHITLEKANSIVEKLVELGAIDTELWQQKVIWCQKFVDNIEEVYHNRRRSVPLKPNFITQTILHNNYTNLPVENHITTPNLPVANHITTPNLPVETPISTPRSTQSKVEYSRVKNIYIETFKNFWTIYPKKIGKSTAERAFVKLAPDETLFTTIIDAVKKQTEWEQWKTDNGKYIPNASTWLNQRRWEDETPQIKNNGHKPESQPVKKYRELSELPD